MSDAQKPELTSSQLDSALGQIERVCAASGGCREGNIAAAMGWTATEAKRAIDKLVRQGRVEKFTAEGTSSQFYRPVAQS